MERANRSEACGRVTNSPAHTRELESNGDSVIVSAEECRSVNERVSHHRAVYQVCLGMLKHIGM